MLQCRIAHVGALVFVISLFQAETILARPAPDSSELLPNE